MDEGEKPILDQCVQGAQDADGISGAVGVRGPSGDPGYVQLGNIIQQWGTLTADAVGVAVTFPVPYASVPFVVATARSALSTRSQRQPASPSRRHPDPKP